MQEWSDYLVSNPARSGGLAEWLKATVSKTVLPKGRHRFKSCTLRYRRDESRPHRNFSLFGWKIEILIFIPMHISFSRTQREVFEGNVVNDYLINKDIGVSYQEFSGRGPGKGRYLNGICHEIYIIIEGTATFYVGDDTYQVSPKDLVVVEPGTPHHFETSGMKYFTITRPDWYESQYKEVEE